MAMMSHPIPYLTVIRNGYTGLTELHMPNCYPYGDSIPNREKL